VVEAIATNSPTIRGTMWSWIILCSVVCASKCSVN